MKIGILSMQQITNYGSFLQAYGLKSIIEYLGHTVEFINIIPGVQLPEYKITKLHRFRLIWKRLKVKHPIKQLKATFRLHRRFNKEFKPELGVKQGINSSHFDTVVIGSDEVFNIAQTTWFGFSTQLFGEGIDADNIISYAACFGATSVKKIKELGLSERIASLLNKFSSLSIRDENSYNVIKSLTGKKANMHVDPVFAYDFDKEIRVPKVKEDYMLIYTYPGRMTNPDEVEAIKAYAVKKNLKIIAIANYFDWVDEVVTPHPFEVLGYFQKATCIITDTFHGSVLSIKYNRPFVTIVRNMNSNKLTGLLSQFNLTNRMILHPADLTNLLEDKIEYTQVNRLIKEEKKRSYDYLYSNLVSDN